MTACFAVIMMAPNHSLNRLRGRPGLDGQDEVRSLKNLIQLGLRDPGQQGGVGLKAFVPPTVYKVVAHFDRAYVEHSELTHRMVANLLSTMFSQELFQNVVVRGGGSTTFLLHQSSATELLPRSGQAGVFYKTHAQHEPHHDILWMEPDIHLEDVKRLLPRVLE